jgi:hypothetical protein
MNQQEITTQIFNYNRQLSQLRATHRGYWFDESHEGFIAIDDNHERIGGWEFYGEEFSESNLEKMFTIHPDASYVIFSTRLNGTSDESEDESGVALDHSIMTFNNPNQS